MADHPDSVVVYKIQLQVIHQRRAIKSVPKQAIEIPEPETRALFREAKRLKGFITDGKSVPVAFFNYERRHSWERAI
jgi:hypothetical protein